MIFRFRHLLSHHLTKKSVLLNEGFVVDAKLLLLGSVFDLKELELAGRREVSELCE